MWKIKKNSEQKYDKSLQEALNGNLPREQRSLEQLLKLWKDRPRRAKEEIPDETFQVLQKQHSIEEHDS